MSAVARLLSPVQISVTRLPSIRWLARPMKGTAPGDCLQRVQSHCAALAQARASGASEESAPAHRAASARCSSNTSSLIGQSPRFRSVRSLAASSCRSAVRSLVASSSHRAHRVSRSTGTPAIATPVTRAALS
jgi:hypothetical protein